MTTRYATLFALLFGLAASGCAARTVCDDAVDKLNECGLPPSSTGSCDTDVDRCEANCINAHTCADIQAALGGTPNAYSACDDACR